MVICTLFDTMGASTKCHLYVKDIRYCKTSNIGSPSPLSGWVGDCWQERFPTLVQHMLVQLWAMFGQSFCHFKFYLIYVLGVGECWQGDSQHWYNIRTPLGNVSVQFSSFFSFLFFKAKMTAWIADLLLGFCAGCFPISLQPKQNTTVKPFSPGGGWGLLGGFSSAPRYGGP